MPKPTGMILLDACYSGEASKGVVSITPRFVPLQERSQPAAGRFGAAIRQALSATKDVEVYPYRNVVTLAASSRYEQALDIDPRSLRNGQMATVDGSPHGVFTNALLSAMDGGADANQDGSISHLELFQYVNDNVSSEFPQHPQFLVSPDNQAIRQSPILSYRPASFARKPDAVLTPPGGRALLRVEGVAPSIVEKIRAVPGVTISASRRDLTLRAEPSGDLALYQGENNWIRTYGPTQQQSLLDDLRALAAAQELINFRFLTKTLDVEFETDPVGQAWFYDQQKFTPFATPSKSAQLLVLAVDGTGHIDVLYPTGPATSIAANQRANLGSMTVGPPFGYSFLKVLAFRELPAGLQQFSCSASKCPDFPATSEQFQQLMRTLRATEEGGEASLRITTRP